MGIQQYTIRGCVGSVKQGSRCFGVTTINNNCGSRRVSCHFDNATASSMTNAECWKRRYLEKVAAHQMVPAEEKGQHVVEFATKVVEELMHSEDSYLYVSGWHSDRACKKYRKSIGLLIWTKGSTFYQCLCLLLVVHVRSYSW